MIVKKIADGAFFVPPYFTKNINSHVPGLINQSIAVDEIEREEEQTRESDEVTKEDFEGVLRRIARPAKKAAARKR